MMGGSSCSGLEGRTGLGSLFMAGLPGPELDDSTRRLIRDLGICNFIYFKRNVVDPQQLAALSRSLGRACADSGLPPPLIAIDQEGGSVTRLPPPFTQFPDARELAAARDPVREFNRYARLTAGELSGAGINWNLAPVLDVCAAGRGLFMERRSLGGDPEIVGRWGCLIIEELQKGAAVRGVAACAKHFPGLGAAVVDPHFQLPVVDRPAGLLREVDLAPFRAAVNAGVAAVMTSHTLYPALDEARPATLSSPILTTLLREELRYEGVVITDDLEMGAIEEQGAVGEAAVQAFRAGADLLLICHDHDRIAAARAAIARELARGAVSGERYGASLARVEKMRLRFAG